MTEDKTKRINLRSIDAELWREFKAQAALLDIPVSQHVQDALKKHLKDTSNARCKPGHRG